MAHTSKYKSDKVVRVDMEWHECESYLDEYMEPLGGRDFDYTRISGDRYGYGESQQRWHGASWQEQQKLLADGTHEGLEDADELLELVESTLDLYGLGPEYRTSVIGSTPRVAAYLQGAPNAMNRWVEDQSPTGALNIWIGTAVSGSVLQSELYKKGVACVALARAVSKYRPVNLYAYDNSGVWVDPKYNAGAKRRAHRDVLTVVKLPTNPLDLSALVAAVTTIAVSRGFFHNAAHAAVGNVASKATANVHGRPYADIAFSRSTVVDLIEPGPDDLVISNSYGPDLRACLLDPLTWIQTEMRRALKGEGAATRDVYAECEITKEMQDRVKEILDNVGSGYIG